MMKRMITAAALSLAVAAASPVLAADRTIGIMLTNLTASTWFTSLADDAADQS
jgi:hypothetical protein